MKKLWCSPCWRVCTTIKDKTLLCVKLLCSRKRIMRSREKCFAMMTIYSLFTPGSINGMEYWSSGCKILLIPGNWWGHQYNVLMTRYHPRSSERSQEAELESSRQNWVSQRPREWAALGHGPLGAINLWRETIIIFGLSGAKLAQHDNNRVERNHHPLAMQVWCCFPRKHLRFCSRKYPESVEL